MVFIKRIIFVLLSLSFFHSAVVTAEEEEPELITAGELLASCEDGSVPGSPNQYCMRYVFGLVQTVIGIQKQEQSAPIFCIDPQVIRLEAATDNVIAYLRGQSSRTKEEAQTLVLEALNKNYPCSGSGSRT